MGDKVYAVDFNTKTILTMEVSSITITAEAGVYLELWNGEDMCSWECFVDEMAENYVYFNREEAEKALEERKEK